MWQVCRAGGLQPPGRLEDDPRMDQAPSPRPTVAQVFDSLADSYDQSGVEFFGPVAERLVALLAPQTGERALDLGCGRGAVTVPLEQAVGSSGAVPAVDISAAMVAATRELVGAAGLDHVTVVEADAADPALEPAGHDVVGSSLVLFFLPEPLAALTRW